MLRGSNIYVMRVNNDNTVEKVSVETGIGLGGFVEVIGNVDQGDRIITRGGEGTNETIKNILEGGN